MMNYEIFKEVVKEKFMDYMPDNFKGMELVVMPVEKVNMTYDGISIRGKDTNISPTIYINDMYEKYQSCGDLEETLMAACDLMAMEFAKTPQVVDVDSLYKDADEKVVFQLINTEQNKSFLEQVPHREFQDLSIIYKLVINADAESIQSIKVTNSLAERFGMNEEQLFKYAAENTRRILPPRIRNMNDVMKEMFLSDGMPEEIAEMMIREVPPEQTLWIISNNRGIDGAVSMLYENELHELAENLESDLYILPSSVHEVLAVSTELTEPEELFQDLHRQSPLPAGSILTIMHLRRQPQQNKQPDFSSCFHAPPLSCVPCQSFHACQAQEVPAYIYPYDLLLSDLQIQSDGLLLPEMVPYNK